MVDGIGMLKGTCTAGGGKANETCGNWTSGLCGGMYGLGKLGFFVGVKAYFYSSI